jgi:hypothetical protein
MLRTNGQPGHHREIRRAMLLELEFYRLMRHTSRGTIALSGRDLAAPGQLRMERARVESHFAGTANKGGSE